MEVYLSLLVIVHVCMRDSVCGKGGEVRSLLEWLIAEGLMDGVSLTESRFFEKGM